MIRMKLMGTAFAFVLLSSTSAFAAITIDGAPPYPSNPAENVLVGGDETGTTVVGQTNLTNTNVYFKSSETLIEPSAGQARITALDGQFSDLEILFDYNVTKIEFNLDVFKIDNKKTTGQTTLTFYNMANFATIGTFDISSAGSNFFTAFSSPGDFIQRVTISTTTPLAAIAQVRVEGFEDVITPPTGLVPEPATWAMMLMGFFGIGSALRSSRRRPAALA